ncbi:sigma factor-like helix-turn-helix DNA-binding protein [Xanthomonas populi]|uniref:sigma factor-like helix-turn-helix DNA-binding protein n=1 Tax=Xanthomonas populi TaxID=53414 RepID=UPI001FCA0100|nr:sigma factor-like helix-turn-helix DNA-binding protein [Xanthomonas populi]
MLAHLQELSYAQIAQRLGVSSSSVRQSLTRANRHCLFALSACAAQMADAASRNAQSRGGQRPLLAGGQPISRRSPIRRRSG